jgi:hypothetical protein
MNASFFLRIPLPGFGLFVLGPPRASQNARCEHAPAARRRRAKSMARTKFAVIDCEDAAKWEGHESIWVAAYGRPGEHWCVLGALSVKRAHAC